MSFIIASHIASCNFTKILKQRILAMVIVNIVHKLTKSLTTVGQRAKQILIESM